MADLSGEEYDVNIDEDLEETLPVCTKVSDVTSDELEVYCIDYDLGLKVEGKKIHKDLLGRGIRYVRIMQFESVDDDEFVYKTFGDIQFYPSFFAVCKDGTFFLPGGEVKLLYNLEVLIHKVT